MLIELASLFEPTRMHTPNRLTQVGQALMVLCEEEDQVEALSKVESPGVDLYADDAGAMGHAIATYQGYLNGKTPAE